MKYPIIHLPFLPVAGMALFPFILIKEKRFSADPVFINHEKIHLRQQLEMLILPFYICYLLNYLINLLIYKNHFKSYYNIIFEKEAYAMDKNFNYLKKRKLWAWRKFTEL